MSAQGDLSLPLSRGYALFRKTTGHAFKRQHLRGLHPSVAGHDYVLAVDQDWVREPQGLDAFDDLLELQLRMRPGIPLPGAKARGVKVLAHRDAGEQEPGAFRILRITGEYD